MVMTGDEDFAEPPLGHRAAPQVIRGTMMRTSTFTIRCRQLPDSRSG